MAKQSPAEAPLSARSVALTLMLGARPPRLSARDLTSLGEMFGISAATMRVALSRMVAAGDLVVSDAIYTLAPHHLERQTVTENLLHPRRRPYTGRWRMAVVVDRGRSAAQRAALRARMAQDRFAELREGVWVRPDNLHLPAETGDAESDGRAGLQRFTTVPEDDRALTRQVWDLPAWTSEAHRLLDALAPQASPIDRLTAAAATVRHLCTDPALPEELRPEQWPADELRWAYEDYGNEVNRQYLSIRDDLPETAADDLPPP
jgi:phenylacetic acid degradation operon negative regulatory protein